MILFFGPTGSGKSVQAQLLVDNDGWKWLSTGQLLQDTDDEEVHFMQRKGVLVPIEKVNQILGKALDKITSDDKLILDGYPRQINQTNWLIDNCKSRNLSIDLAVNFDVHLEELLKRIELRGRDDDNPESIKERFTIYRREIDPILNLLSKDGIKVININGVGTPDEIHKRIKDRLIKCKLVKN